MAAKPQGATASKEARKGDPSEMAEPIDPGREPLVHEPDPLKTSWIEVRLVDEADEPIQGALYEITVPSGRIARGRTNKEGVGRVEGIDPGSCDVCFPDLDAEAWEEA